VLGTTNLAGAVTGADQGMDHRAARLRHLVHLAHQPPSDLPEAVAAGTHRTRLIPPASETTTQTPVQTLLLVIVAAKLLRSPK